MQIRHSQKNTIKIYELCLLIYLTWYFLPIFRAYFRGAMWNMVFFSFFILGFALWLIEKYHNQTVKLKMTYLVPVFIYMVMLIFMSILSAGTAINHIRISFTFWGTGIVYYMLNDNKAALNRFCVWFIILYIITIITTYTAVLTDNSLARMLTSAANDIQEDLVYMRKNVSNIFLIQCSVLFVPLIISNIINNRYKLINFILLFVELLFLINASFTISFILFVFAVVFSYICYSKNTLNKLIFTMLAVIILLVINWEGFFSMLANIIDNEKISDRLQDIANAILTGKVTASSNLDARFRLYSYSFETFLGNPFGVGPEYTFVAGQNGIGYHSQILDDMARYGIFAIAFYVMFFRYYYKLLKSNWKLLDMERVTFPIVFIYGIFLLINPGFTSSIESIVVLLLLPSLPKTLLYFKENKLKKLEFVNKCQEPQNRLKT